MQVQVLILEAYVENLLPPEMSSDMIDSIVSCYYEFTMVTLISGHILSLCFFFPLEKALILTSATRMDLKYICWWFSFE